MRTQLPLRHRPQCKTELMFFWATRVIAVVVMTTVMFQDGGYFGFNVIYSFIVQGV